MRLILECQSKLNPITLTTPIFLAWIKVIKVEHLSCQGQEDWIRIVLVV